MTLEEFYATELSRLHREWLAGRPEALPEVVASCGMWNVPLPAWAIEPLVAALVSPPVTRRGRTGSAAARATQNDIHAIRWNWCRFALGAHIADAAGRKAFRKHVVGLRTAVEAFGFASTQLRGTPAQGEAGAMKRSYKLVEAALKRGEGGRFRLGGDTLHGFGPANSSD